MEMIHTLRSIFLSAVILALFGGFAHGQSGLPPAPVPVTPGSPAGDGAVNLQPPPPSSANQIPPPPSQPPGVPMPGYNTPPLAPVPPMGGYFPDNNPPPPPLMRIWREDRGQNDGWFGTFDLNIVGPHITNNITGFVNSGGATPDVVALPTADLEWTGSPRFELGYRFCDGWGQLSLSYRLLETEGSAILPGFDLDGSDGFLHSHLDMNVIDFDYGSRLYRPGPQTDLQWRLGLRVATAFFSSEAEGNFIEQHFSNDFWGIGPHGLLDVHHQLGNSNLGLFGRIESAVAFGDVHQSFEETFVASDGSLLGGVNKVSVSQAAPMLDLQLGVSWTPRWRYYSSRYSFGYVWEKWWNVGSVAGSSADITTQGVFFRGELNY
jgi:hypothetical protein